MCVMSLYRIVWCGEIPRQARVKECERVKVRASGECDIRREVNREPLPAADKHHLFLNDDVRQDVPRSATFNT